MKYKALSVILLILLIFSFIPYASRYAPSPNSFFSAAVFKTDIQTEKPPTQNYWDRIYGRNTSPLGLKENKTLNQLLGQPQIKWVIRSEQRHILN
ncbi:MAG: hypothetical protein MUP98_00050 [Candidatus Aminicenantes bacterium]|nr:hypothetical protein [Candidatus Aminicenantes bacterium]